MLIKTADLIGHALDWAVATAEEYDIEIRPAGPCGRPLYMLAAEKGHRPWTFNPSFSWHHGGEIIEREKIDTIYDYLCNDWVAYGGTFAVSRIFIHGPTPLIAAMRVFVKHKLGDKVEIPDALMETV